MARGFNVASDVIKTTVDGYDLNKIWTDLTQVLQSFNASKTPLLNLLTVAHDQLEAYVFEQAIARLNDDNYWRKRKSESDPHAERKIGALNDRRERLAGRRSRVLEMFEDGDLSRAERRDRLDAIEAESELIGKDIEKLVGAPDIEKAFGTRDKLLAAWPKWTPGQRRAFLRLLIDRVVVDEWPAGMAHYRPPRRGESNEEYAVERKARVRRALEARVTIEWRD